MVSQTSQSQLKAALQAGDKHRVISLCQQLESNLKITVRQVEQSIAHHVALLPDGLQCLEALTNRLGPSCLISTNEHKNTPVHIAALKQDHSWMEFIYRALQDTECFLQPGYLKRTAIHMAAMNEHDNSALKWLAKHCGTRAILLQTDEDGDMPVHLAACFQGSDSMQFLKELLGPDCFNQRGQAQRTAIHNAAVNEVDNSALEWLAKECGIRSLTVSDEDDNSPVHLAATFQGSTSMQLFESLLGVECFYQRGHLGRTVIHAAALSERSNSALEWLITRLGPTCLLEDDSSGATPVHLAAQNQDLDSFQLIVDSLGADSAFDLLDAEGQTVADYAKLNKQYGPQLLEYIAQKLLSGSADSSSGEDRRLSQASGSSPSRRPSKRSDKTPATSPLDPEFVSWDFLLDDADNEQLIGEGGFGRVYKAVTDKKQIVAVKIVKHQNVQLLDQAVNREIAEISVLKSIQHPNILRFLRSEYTAQFGFCIFTELIEGRNLSDQMKINGSPFGEPAVRNFTEQICSALDYLHSRKRPVLHRDIKCSNIMLTEDGVIKLIDFGLAREAVATSRGHSTDSPCGTWHFMAPEIFSCDERFVFTKKTDVFAFGCAVYEMLEAEPPNSRLSPMQLPLHVTSHRMPKIPARVSVSLNDFYRRCVVRNPKKRADIAELRRHSFLGSGSAA